MSKYGRIACQHRGKTCQLHKVQTTPIRRATLYLFPPAFIWFLPSLGAEAEGPLGWRGCRRQLRNRTFGRAAWLTLSDAFLVSAAFFFSLPAARAAWRAAARTSGFWAIEGGTEKARQYGECLYGKRIRD